MMIISAARAAAAAVTATLAFSSGRNMVQTFQISREYTKAADDTTLLPLSAIKRYSSDSFASAANVVKELEQMKRKDILELYLSSEPPENLSDIEGEWNGVLLDNNGIVLTVISKILSNDLFGRGRKWNGKAFLADGTGINRFHSKSEPFTTETEHTFDYALGPTSLRSNGDSVCMRYNEYQSRLSLWHGMRDEVRILPLLSSSGNVVEGAPQVLVGLGSLSWSGGISNASPFCLWRDGSNESSRPSDSSSTC